MTKEQKIIFQEVDLRGQPVKDDTGQPVEHIFDAEFDAEAKSETPPTDPRTKKATTGLFRGFGTGFFGRSKL